MKRKRAGSGDSKAKTRPKSYLPVYPKVDLTKVTAKVDNKPPRFNPDIYLKTLTMVEDEARLKVVDKENLELLQRMNVIHRMGGKVDCSLPTGRTYKSKLFGEAEELNKRIAKENKKLLAAIVSARANYSTAEFLEDWKRVELNLEHTARYPLIWKDQDTMVEDVVPIGMEVNPVKRTRCFFDVELAKSGESLGRIIFELYDDFAPDTCANFAALCRGSDQGLSYKGTPFHRILPKYWCQGGDVTLFNGVGGASIYGDKFKDENFTLRHVGPGILSMWSEGPDTNNSKFNITFNSLKTMDGKRVVFGRVLRGLSSLYKIEELGCRVGKPIRKVIVSNCGVTRSKEQKDVDED